MKKIGLIIILVIIFSGCNLLNEISGNELEIKNNIYYKINSNKPFTGRVKVYSNRGSLLGKLSFRNGVIEGYYELYYENGSIESKGILPDGFYKEYYENGNLYKEEIYRNDELYQEKIY